MKYTQGDIAEIYGDDWDTLVNNDNTSRIAYLRSKLTYLNTLANLEYFYGNLDLTNKENFKIVTMKKLHFLEDV